jgi:hypothetical protein
MKMVAVQNLTYQGSLPWREKQARHLSPRFRVSSAPRSPGGPTLRPQTGGHDGPSPLAVVRTSRGRLSARSTGSWIGGGPWAGSSIRRILPRAEMEAQRLQQVLDLSGGRDARTRRASRPESRLTGLRSVPTESPQNPDPQLTWFGRRHVFVLVRMTDHATVLARMRPCSPTRAPSSPARWVLNSPPGRLAYPGPSSPAHEERSDRGRCSASRAGVLTCAFEDSRISPRPSASRFDAHSAPLYWWR